MLNGDSAKVAKSVRSKRIISRPLEILLRLFGIWPNMSYSLFFKMLWLFIITLIGIYQYSFIVVHFTSLDLTICMYAVSYAMAFTAKFIKIIIFWLNQRKFNDMWRTMSKNWQRGNGTNRDTTSDRIHLMRHLPNMIVGFNSFSVIMSTYGTIANGFHYDEASNFSRHYIIMMDLPFDSNEKSIYMCIIFLQFLYLLIFAAGAATLNSVLIVLIMYLGDQVDIVHRYFTDISPLQNERDASAITVREVVRKHQNIITFSEEIESLYTYIAFELIALNTIVTCGLGFILVTAIRMPNGSTIILKNLLFYCVINIETFVFCFAGEYISFKSKQIGEAAYSSPWYESKPYSRIILFLMMRSQNPLTITMGKFMDLSLQRFASIVKISASYVSVLLAMY